MSTAAQPLVARAAGIRLSQVERIFWRGVMLMTAAILVFKGVHFVEREIFHLSGEMRFVREASHAAAFYSILPHFALAFVFSVTSRRNRTAGRRLAMGGLFVLGIGLCGLFQWLSEVVPAPQLLTDMRYGNPNLVMMILVYAYFLIHDLRDESHFYRALGDAPPIKDERQFNSMVWGLIAMNLAVVGLGLWVVLLVGVPHNVTPVLPSVAWPARIALAAAPIPLWFVAAWLFLRHHAAATNLTIGGLLYRHRVLFRLFACEMVVLAAATAITSRPYPILLLHCAVWYAFARHQLASRPNSSSAAPDWWSWIRGTPQGFRAFHHGLVAGLIVIGIIMAYGAGYPRFVSDHTLFYLSILHITLSWLPR